MLNLLMYHLAWYLRDGFEGDTSYMENINSYRANSV